MGELRSRKQQREQVVRSLRAEGKSWVEVAEVLRQSYRLNARVALRYAHGWSQRQAADEWNKRWPDELKTFKMFSYWEMWPSSTGHAPTFDNLSKLAELYECAVSDLLTDLPDFRELDTKTTVDAGGYAEVPQLTDLIKATDVELDFAPLVSFLGGATIPVEWKDRLHDQLGNLLGEWVNRVNRRELVLRLLGWVAAAIASSYPVSLDADEQERLTKAIALPSRIDAQVIDHIETILRHCKRQEDALGPQAVLQTVLAQRELVDALLTECPAMFRSRLLSVYSSMSSSIGFYCFDLDDMDSAMRYCDQGRAAAQEARDTELAIYALCNMSYFASWQGKAYAGIDFAAAAQSLTSKTDDVLLKVCVAERAGTAYAVDGQYKDCMDQFDKAQAGIVSIDAVSPKSPAYWYHEGLIASQQSDCLLRLGKPHEAASRASTGLQLFDNSFIGSLAFCTLRLGIAYLQSAEVEEAARVIGDGALLATQSRSIRLTREVQAARAQVEAWRSVPVVRELDKQLREMGFVV
jgi:tetratricopeptide (TPR) repeat protein